MKIIKWIVLRRFSYIDVAGQITMAFALSQGRIFTGIAIFGITAMTSIIMIAIAENTCPKS